MLVVLISTYDLGRQPFGLASPAAWLRRAGVAVRCLDLTRDPLDERSVADADAIAFHLPMHTATRLALPAIARVRQRCPGAQLIAYGLYAPPNAALLRANGVETVLGPEYEEDLVRAVLSAAPAAGTDALPRLALVQPDRSGLPPLSRYASLRMPDGSRRITAYTEASRGCKHRCRHCPVVPVYDGRFRIVPPDVVLADIAAQVAAGAQHVTFGDPDFLNGPRHAERIVRALAKAHPGISYDVVVKIEHVLRHPDLMRTLVQTGCLFVTSAVESIDDSMLTRLDKGHTRGDFERAVGFLRGIGLSLLPTFVPFTPWTTRGGYVELLDTLDRLDLVDHVAPIQLAIRLLIPNGSRLLELAEVRSLVDAYDAASLTYPWRHPDPAMDVLQRRVAALVGERRSAGRPELFHAVRALACETAGRPVPLPRDVPRAARATVPYLDEPWYC